MHRRFVWPGTPRTADADDPRSFDRDWPAASRPVTPCPWHPVAAVHVPPRVDSHYQTERFGRRSYSAHRPTLRRRQLEAHRQPIVGCHPDKAGLRPRKGEQRRPIHPRQNPPLQPPNTTATEIGRSRRPTKDLSIRDAVHCMAPTLRLSSPPAHKREGGWRRRARAIVTDSCPLRHEEARTIALPSWSLDSSPHQLRRPVATC